MTGRARSTSRSTGSTRTGPLVANGAATIDLHVGDNVTVAITLHAGASLCGNGQIDTGEACDDHDRLSSGDCDYLCQSRTSGPGVGGSGGGGDGRYRRRRWRRRG